MGKYNPLINYCGPVKLKWLCRLIPNGWGRLNWNFACHLHDDDYWFGGGLFEKVLADIRFLYNIIKHGKGKPLGDKLRLIWVGVVYFVAVTIFGSAHFNWRTVL